MNRLKSFSTRGAIALVTRSRWGLATLAVALFLWGVGALGTPVPALLGTALAGIAGLLLLALGRFRARRRSAFAVAERGQTQTSLALYGTSALLASLFLAGVFAQSRSTIVGSAPAMTAVASHVSTAAASIPGLAASPALAATAPLLSDNSSLQDLGHPSAVSTDSLGILSLNVWHGYPGPGAREDRYQRIRDLVTESGADVVLLQEAWSTRRFGSLAERLSRDLGLGFAYARANGSLRYLGFEEGLAILSRYPISGARRLGLAPRMPFWEMRVALGAVVALPGGDSLEVWTAHLSHSDGFARDGQARSLALALRGSDVAILGGDFNAAAASPAVAAFAGLDLEPLLSEGIDHILGSAEVRAEWTPLRAEALHFGELMVPGALLPRPEVSDHPALLLELRRLGPSGA